jgi:phosphohistidine swiveling domain-containing protein
MSASVTASSDAVAPSTASTFPIDWANPADAEKTWEWDDMHMPMCLTPLAGDYAVLLAEGDAYGSRRMGIPFEFRGQVIHGYVYYVSRHDVPEDEVPAARERATALYREQIPLAAEYWRGAVDELRGIWSWMAAIPVEDLAHADVADAWDEAWRRMLRAWQIHFYAIVGPYEILDVLADFYEAVLPDAPKGEALRLIQGTIHELTDVDTGIGRLAELAVASPELTAEVARGETSPEVLAALPGGATFVEELDAFLMRHGHLGQNWDDLALPSFAEEPSRLLAEVAKRMQRASEPAHERAARLARDADALADAFRAGVADEPEKLAEFERILETARQIGHITETHNYWIDRMGQARLRTLSLRVGRRLVEAGVIESPDHVFFLHRAEVSELLRRPADRTGLVLERSADHIRWAAVRPPAVVGRPRLDQPPNRFGGDTAATENDGILRGTGGSRGTATGSARVVLGPDDFERVQPGDIIVAPSSNPSWVPLFAIAGGLVTNTGGVLSHAAVVARELDLPAVVGVADATSRIRDGQIVEIDGTTGTVRPS